MCRFYVCDVELGLENTSVYDLYNWIVFCCVVVYLYVHMYICIYT